MWVAVTIFNPAMALFGLGNILLKIKRSGLPRPHSASLFSVLIAIAAVTAGLVGNAVLNPHYLGVFLEYFISALLVVAIMLGRITILQACLFVVRAILFFLIHRMTATSQAIRKKIDQISAQQIVFFNPGGATWPTSIAPCCMFSKTSTPNGSKW